MFSGSGAPSVVSYEVQDRIASVTRVCSYDRPGLGWSEPARDEYGLVQSAQDLEELLKQAGEDGPFVLAPESYGGMIALLVASDEANNVAGMVLIDSSEPELWFEKTGETLDWWSRRHAMMNFAWETGLVRMLLTHFQPDWIENMSAQNREWFWALYSRQMPGYNELQSA